MFSYNDFMRIYHFLIVFVVSSGQMRDVWYMWRHGKFADPGTVSPGGPETSDSVGGTGLSTSTRCLSRIPRGHFSVNETKNKFWWARQWLMLQLCQSVSLCQSVFFLSILSVSPSSVFLIWQTSPIWMKINIFCKLKFWG